MKNLLETESLPNVRILFQQMKDSIITNFNSIYIKGSTPISWSSSGGQRERERETERETERERKKERGGVKLSYIHILRCVNEIIFGIKDNKNEKYI